MESEASYPTEFTTIVDIDVARAPIHAAIRAAMEARGEQPNNPAEPVDGALRGDVPLSNTEGTED